MDTIEARMKEIKKMNSSELLENLEFQDFVDYLLSYYGEEGIHNDFRDRPLTRREAEALGILRVEYSQHPPIAEVAVNLGLSKDQLESDDYAAYQNCEFDSTDREMVREMMRAAPKSIIEAWLVGLPCVDCHNQTHDLRQVEPHQNLKLISMETLDDSHEPEDKSELLKKFLCRVCQWELCYCAAYLFPWTKITKHSSQ